MYTQLKKTKENAKRGNDSSVGQKNRSDQQFIGFLYNPPEVIIRRMHQEIVNDVSRIRQLKAYREIIDRKLLNDKIIQMMYANRMAASFSNEVEEANNAASETDYDNGPGPYVGGTPGFNRFVNSGRMFKWIYGEKNGIVVISTTLKHSVAAGGADVILSKKYQIFFYDLFQVPRVQRHNQLFL